MTGVQAFILLERTTGDLDVGYFQPQDNNYTLGSTIPLKAYVYDDCALNVTTATVTFNISSGTYSTTTTATKGATDTYENNSYTLPSSAPLGWYNVTVKATATNYWNGIWNWWHGSVFK